MESHWQILNRGDIISSHDPQSLWNNAIGYFKWCDDNPIKYNKTIMTGKEAGTSCLVTEPRPYTIKGLCLHCGIVEQYLSDIKSTKDQESLFYLVVEKIVYVIHTQNIEMAMVGVFNPIITSKLLSIDNEEVVSSPVQVNVVTGLPRLSTSEKEVLDNEGLPAELAAARL